MKIIRVVVNIKPESVPKFLEYMGTEAPIIRKMKGCERYQLLADPTSDTTFVLYEEWSSGEDFAAFQASPELKKSFEVLGPMLAGPPQSAYFDATKTN